jgi:two-component system LytT family response regulator
MRVLIVDDEAPARRGVALRLRGFDDVTVIGECGDGASAVQLIRAHAPDVVFLDIQMPDVDGFGVVQALSARERPLIIFLTAFQRHAVQAFDVDAVDYLLKPIDDERFVRAIDRARRALSASKPQHPLEGPSSDSADRAYVSRLPVRSGQRTVLISVSDIACITAAGDYAELHVARRAHLIRESMAALEAKLDPSEFVRIHRSTIVAARQVVELEALENREYLVRLKDGSQHRSSRTRAPQVEAWLRPG